MQQHKLHIVVGVSVHSNLTRAFCTSSLFSGVPQGILSRPTCSTTFT